MATAQGVDLRSVLAPVVEAAGFDLEDVEVTPVGRRSLVRIAVDSDDGVDLDAVSRLSRAIAEALDASDTAFGAESGAGAYTLEVSSPGVDRPLTLARHWRRALDRLVTVVAGGSEVTGRVSDADDSTVTLAIDGDPHSYPLTELGPGRVQVEFSRPDKPGPSGRAVARGTSASARSRSDVTTDTTRSTSRDTSTGVRDTGTNFTTDTTTKER